MSDHAMSKISSGLCFILVLLCSTPVLVQGTLFVKNQKVEIGTAAPTYDLHLVSSSASANLWIEGASNGASSGAMEFVDGTHRLRRDELRGRPAGLDHPERPVGRLLLRPVRPSDAGRGPRLRLRRLRQASSCG